MANIVIKDLEMTEELSENALQTLAGGWGWYSHTSSSAAFWGPYGGGSYHSSSTSMGWGYGGWGFPWGWF